MAQICSLNKIFLIICIQLTYLIFVFIFAIVLSMAKVDCHLFSLLKCILAMAFIILFSYLFISLLFELNYLLVILNEMISCLVLPSKVKLI